MKRLLKKFSVAIFLLFAITEISFAQKVTGISNDMFKYQINKIKTSNLGETYSLTFGQSGTYSVSLNGDTCNSNNRPCHCQTNNDLNVSFPIAEINENHNIVNGACVSREFKFADGIESYIKTLTLKSKETTLDKFQIMPFESSDKRTKTKNSNITGYTENEALSHVIELTDNNGNTIKDLELSNETITFTNYSVIHLKSLKMNAGAKIVNNSKSTVLIVDENVEIKGDPSKCVFKPSSLEYENIDMSSCAFLYGVYIIAGGSIKVDYAFGDYTDKKYCSDGFLGLGNTCNNVYISNDYNAAKGTLRDGISIAPAYFRLSAPQITITNSLIGEHKSNWNFKYEPIEETLYEIIVPSKVVTCETVEVKITSSSSQTKVVNVSLEGVGTFEDGSTSKEVAISSESPATLLVKSNKIGSTVVKVESVKETINFDSSALRLYRKDGDSIKNLSNTFYAGEPQDLYVGVVVAEESDPTQCVNKKLQDQKLNLSITAIGGYAATLEKYEDGSKCRKNGTTDSGSRSCDSSSVLANTDPDGIDVLLEQDGDFYKLPKLTSYDAIPFVVKAKGILAYDETETEGEVNELSAQWPVLVSPYKIEYDRENSDFGDFIAGQPLKLKLKACAHNGSSCIPVNYFTAVEIPIEATYRTSSEQTGVEDPNISAPEDLKNYFSETSFDWDGSGILDLENTIDDVGAYDFTIKDFYHISSSSEFPSISSLKIHGFSKEAMFTDEHKLYPYGFAIALDGSLLAAENACIKRNDQEHSFTYFGQPLPLKVNLIAKTAKLNNATHMSDLGCDVNLEPTVFLEGADHNINISVDSNRIHSLSATSSNKLSMTFNDAEAHCIQDLSPSVSTCYVAVDPLDPKKSQDHFNKNYRDELLEDLYDSETKKNRGLDGRIAVRATSDSCTFKELIEDPSNPGKKTNIILDQSSALDSGVLNYDNSVTLKGIVEFRHGRINLIDQRTYINQNLYMPIKFEFYHKKDGWVANTDDHCSVLSLGHVILADSDPDLKPDHFYNNKDYTDLNSGKFFKKYNRMSKNKPKLVNCRKDDCNYGTLTNIGMSITDNVANADHGLVYFKLPAANEKAMLWLKMFTAKDLTIGSGSDSSNAKMIIYGNKNCESGGTPEECHTLQWYSDDSYKKLEPYKSFYQPSWFNLTAESKNTSLGIYDARGDSERVVDRSDQP